jgi:hypothetical protein
MTLDQIADVICEKMKTHGEVWVGRDKILAWLHYSADGQSLVKGLTQSQPTLPARREEALHTFAAQHGARAICKHILEDAEAAFAFSEEEFTDILLQEARKHQRSGESVGTAFSRMFSADTADALLMRKAHAKVKESNCPSLTVGKAHIPPPTQVGGKDATSINDPSAAYGQLAAMAERLRALSPWLTFHQAFARVYSDPNNSALAEAERSHNRPRVNKDLYQR